MSTQPVRRRTAGAVVLGTLVVPPSTADRWPRWTSPPAPRDRDRPLVLPPQVRRHLEGLAFTTDQLDALDEALTDLSPADEPWQTRAACASVDVATSDRFTDALAQQDAAGVVVRYCRACPVAAQCLRAGVATNSSGAWGGVVLSHTRRAIAPVTRSSLRPVPDAAPCEPGIVDSEEPAPLAGDELGDHPVAAVVAAPTVDVPATPAPNGPVADPPPHRRGPSRQRWQPRRLTKARRRGAHHR